MIPAQDDVEMTVRGAARSGLFPDLTLHQLDVELDMRTGSDRDDFLQALWDRI